MHYLLAGLHWYKISIDILLGALDQIEKSMIPVHTCKSGKSQGWGWTRVKPPWFIHSNPIRIPSDPQSMPIVHCIVLSIKATWEWDTKCFHFLTPSKNKTRFHLATSLYLWWTAMLIYPLSVINDDCPVSIFHKLFWKRHAQNTYGSFYCQGCGTVWWGKPYFPLHQSVVCWIVPWNCEIFPFAK